LNGHPYCCHQTSYFKAKNAPNSISAPDPAGGAYNAFPDPLAGFKGPTFKGREGRKDGREGRAREGRLERGGLPPPNLNTKLAHAYGGKPTSPYSLLRY